ncbi:hypothetical protein [Flavihumibacter fluvii]|uniref:hypothetical protein n=1 Tax=Flavihumibacter fluvii TaxID=2838157 RepID=UPI001BDE5D0B|nr:hypothetical protein [Flavihumibacter fluvii]ULQ52650.1 hypothetical protein KJS93_21410 [Flavihumibacter fluvii]
MTKYFFFAGIISGGLLGCTKEGPVGDKYIRLSYGQTYCSDPWGNTGADSINLKKMGIYLDSIKLYVADAELKQVSAPDMCAACFCKTGKVFYVTTFDEPSMVSKFRDLGFE